MISFWSTAHIQGSYSNNHFTAHVHPQCELWNESFTYIAPIICNRPGCLRKSCVVARAIAVQSRHYNRT